MTLIPDHFLPAIGLVIVNHAFMDTKLQAAICILAGINYNSGVSILAPIYSTSTRAEILQNLARTTAMDMTSLCKLLVLGDLIVEASTERNIIAHTLPYFHSPSKDPLDPFKDEIGYFKEINKTIPQIKQQPPYTANLESLTKLSRKMLKIGACLAGLEKNYLPDGVDLSGMTSDERITYIRSHATHSPVWNDDGQFPWPDKFERKLQNESQKPQNSQRVRKPPPQS